MVREIAATVVRLATGQEPPGRGRIRALHPGAHDETLNEGYRIGCLDLVLGTGDEPMKCETREERAVIEDRAARLWAWKMAHPSSCGPTHAARR